MYIEAQAKNTIAGTQFVEAKKVGYYLNLLTNHAIGIGTSYF